MIKELWKIICPSVNCKPKDIDINKEAFRLKFLADKDFGTDL